MKFSSLSFEELWDYFHERGIISHRTGILKYVHKFTPETGDTPIKIFGGKVATPSIICGKGKIPNVGGAGRTDKSAFLACIGEAFERYCATFTQDLIFGSAKETGGELGWPEFSDVSYTKQQAYKKLRETSKISWTSAVSLMTGEKKLVPASLVYLPYFPCQEEEIIAFPSISTGLAAHQTTEKAIKASILELLERDAFTLAWLSGQPIPTVPNGIIQEYKEKYGVPGHWKMRVVDLTNNTLVPVYLCSILAKTSIGNIFAIGCSSGFNASEALDKAIMEALHTVPYVRHLIRIEPDWDPGNKLENLHTFKDHSKIYSVRPDLMQGVRYIFPGKPKLFASDPDEKEKVGSTNELLCHLNDIGIEIFIKRMTTQDVKQIGFEVIRAVSPQLMPLHSHYQLPYLKCNRLWNLDKVFPYPINKLSSEKEVFPYPHPFA